MAVNEFGVSVSPRKVVTPAELVIQRVPVAVLESTWPEVPAAPVESSNAAVRVVVARFVAPETVRFVVLAFPSVVWPVTVSAPEVVVFPPIVAAFETKSAEDEALPVAVMFVLVALARVVLPLTVSAPPTVVFPLRLAAFETKSCEVVAVPDTASDVAVAFAKVLFPDIVSGPVIEVVAWRVVVPVMVRSTRDTPLAPFASTVPQTVDVPVERRACPFVPTSPRVSRSAAAIEVM